MLTISRMTTYRLLKAKKLHISEILFIIYLPWLLYNWHCVFSELMYEDPLFPYVKLKSNFITFNCVCLAISLSAIDQKSKHTNWAHIQRKSWKYCALIWSPFRRFKHQEFRLRSLFTQSQQNLKNAIEWAFVLLNSNHGSTYIFTLLHYQPVSQTKTIYDEVITSRNKIPVKKSEANEKQTKNESKAAPRKRTERLAECTSKVRRNFA